jgi:hypothetical protein
MSSSVELWPVLSPPVIGNIYEAGFNTEATLPVPSGPLVYIANAPALVQFIDPTATTWAGDGQSIAPMTPTLLNVPRAQTKMVLQTRGFGVYATMYSAGGDPNKIPYASMTAPEAVGVYTYNYSTPEIYDLAITGSAEVLLTPTEIVYVVFGSVDDADLDATAMFMLSPENPMRFKLTPASTRMSILGEGGVGTNTMRMSFIGQVL